MRRVFLKCAVLAALACVTTAFSLSVASAAIFYNPIVTCYGDGNPPRHAWGDHFGVPVRCLA